MTDEKEIISAMMLARTCFYRTDVLHTLYEKLGSVSAIMEHHDDIADILPDATPKLSSLLRDTDSQRKRVEEELEYDSQHKIRPLVIGCKDYPKRLASCPDAPLVLFYLGNADLNSKHIINVVGTRKCTRYGQDIVRVLMRDLASLCPDTLVVSGLAYGVDICAHRESLTNRLDTVGVLAHGLDELYPPAHRETAREMVYHGGLLTEYFTHTKADKLNFVRRNRIVAGITDATILIESAERGGGLITCSIAGDYGRSVLAFPGPIGAKYSEGCNNLIRDNGAQLVTSAADIVKALGWDNDAIVSQAADKGIERQLFPNLNEEQQKVVESLKKQNDQQINMLAVSTSLPVGKLMSLLFELEMMGVVKLYAGGSYHLLN